MGDSSQGSAKNVLSLAWPASLAPSLLNATLLLLILIIFFFFFLKYKRSVQCSCFVLVYVLISHRIGTHQIKGDRGSLLGAMQAGATPQVMLAKRFAEKRLEGCSSGPAPFAFPIPTAERGHPEWVGPHSSRLPASSNSPARGTAAARALESGFWARFFWSSGTRQQPPAASQSHGHGLSSPRLQPVAPDRCKAGRSPASACRDCKYQGW